MDEMKNYMRIEEFKHLLITKLHTMGLKDYLDASNDADIHNIMVLCNQLLKYMHEKQDDEEKIELLVTYIVGLWARLIIYHGDDPNEL